MNRETIVSIVVFALAIAAGLELFDAAKGQSDPYQIATQTDRLAPVADSIPGNAVVGYVSDVDSTSAFFSAAYAVAPRLLIPAERAAEGSWVLGNFSAPQDFAAFGAQRSLALQRDLGNGVILFKKAGPK